MSDADKTFVREYLRAMFRVSHKWQYDSLAEATQNNTCVSRAVALEVIGELMAGGYLERSLHLHGNHVSVMVNLVRWFDA